MSLNLLLKFMLFVQVKNISTLVVSLTLHLSNHSKVTLLRLKRLSLIFFLMLLNLLVVLVQLMLTLENLILNKMVLLVLDLKYKIVVSVLLVNKKLESLRLFHKPIHLLHVSMVVLVLVLQFLQDLLNLWVDNLIFIQSQVKEQHSSLLLTLKR